MEGVFSCSFQSEVLFFDYAIRQVISIIHGHIALYSKYFYFIVLINIVFIFIVFQTLLFPKGFFEIRTCWYDFVVDFSSTRLFLGAVVIGLKWEVRKMLLLCMLRTQKRGEEKENVRIEEYRRLMRIQN